MSKTLSWALKRIQNAKEHKSQQLDLSGNSDGLLTYVPHEIFSLTSLRVLTLANNGLTEIPEEIGALNNLSSLNLSGNFLSRDFPKTISKLSNLYQLDLSLNNFTSLPKPIGELKNLSWLNLSRNNLKELSEPIMALKKLTWLNLELNQITTIPISFSGLKNLTTILLSFNQLSNIPSTISELENLSKLDLWHNRLSSLPNTMVRLSKLIELNLGDNNFKDIPDFIYEMRSLENLFLETSKGNNQIKEISPKVLQLENLKILHLEGNPIEIPPLEISEHGAAAIKNYFRQLKSEGQDTLYEAKLLIVGEGGAGKTTLAKKIENTSYQLNDNEKTTEGIDVIKWDFPMEDGKKFRVNIWDFGGQEIYHATHQFFLTRRSLYTLVADTRKEDTDFYYWLNIVELLSDNSPLMIIKNEKQDRHREINERQLRGQFKNLKETIATNLATNRNLTHVIKEIKHYISHLPHVGSNLPRTWIRVREILENDERNYISIDEYLDICKKYGFVEYKDKLQLSGYLHDLGVCLHFQDDPLLSKIIILKPKWGTDAVYKVLDNKTIIRNLGRFNKIGLESVWNSPEYLGMHNELLQLMMKFRLCYKIPNTQDSYIAPQLLTENQPHYDWIESHNLIVRYSYEFMPKGILTQLIVAMQNLIANQSYVWKTGIVLRKEETLAEIIEYYEKREIRIRIQGMHKKALTAIVMYELDKIHETYRRLKYDKLIPCNCSKCKDSQNPHFYKYEVLHKFVADRENHIQCQKSYEMVVVEGLIDDVGSSIIIEKAKARSGNIVFRGTVEQVIVQPRGDIEVSKKEINLSGKTTVYGNIAIETSIKNSFNKITSANISRELQETLKNLTRAVYQMLSLLSIEQAQEAAHNLETLTDEAISDSPRVKWYSVSVEGLKKAAENVGTIGKPVIELAAKVVSLLSTISS